MGYFDDNTKVKFADLERSGKYSLTIMQMVKEGNYDELRKLLSNEIRKDIDYMEPLLYAVKNEKGTYIIYQYYEPKICVASVCVRSGINLEDSELKGNATFMLGAILQDVTALKHASEELKNNYKFMKDACTNNSEVIEYVVEHTDDFGKEALSATKDVVIDESSNNAISGFEQIREEITAQMHDAEGNDLEKSVKKDKQLERHINFFKRVQNGEVDPVRAAKLINKICINIDENFKKQLMIVLKLDEAIQEKEQEITVTQGDVEEHTITEGATVAGMNTEIVSIRQGRESTKEMDDQINDEKQDI